MLVCTYCLVLAELVELRQFPCELGSQPVDMEQGRASRSSGLDESFSAKRRHAPFVGFDGFEHLTPPIRLHGSLQTCAPGRMAFLELFHCFFLTGKNA